MSGKPAAGRGQPGPGTVLGAVGAMLAATACFVGCLTEVSALGREHQAPAAVLIAVAAAFAVAAIVLIRVAIRLEHRIRSAGPAAAGRAGSAGSNGSAAPARQGPVRRPVNGPVARIAAVVIVAGVTAGLVALTLQLHGQAAQSSYTQHHGLARNGRVQAVHAVSHATSTQGWTTYDYDVALTTPAGAVKATVAHDPSNDFQRFASGQTISVLVDPRQPGYAELPGLPVESSSWFVGPVVLGASFLGLIALITTEEVRHRRLRSTPVHDTAAAGAASPRG